MLGSCHLLEHRWRHNTAVEAAGGGEGFVAVIVYYAAAVAGPQRARLRPCICCDGKGTCV
jgi:hypothetical protein